MCRNLEENPDPYSDNIQARAAEVAVFDNDFEEIPDPGSKNVPAGAQEGELFDDDFDIDMVDEALLEVENMNLAPPESSRQRSNNAVSVRVPEEPANRRTDAPREVERTPLAPLNQKTESDMLFDMIDDEIFETVPDNLTKPASDTCSSSKVPKRFLPRGTSSVGDRQDNSSLVTNQPRTSSSDCDRQDSSSLITNKPRTSSSAYSRQENLSLVTNESKTLSSRGIKKPSWSVENPSLATYMELCEETSVDANPTFGRSNDKLTSSADNGNHETLPIKQPNSYANAKLLNRTEVKDMTQTGNKRAASVLTSPMPNQPAEKVRCTQMTPKLVKVNRKITEFIKKDDPSEVAASNTEKCECICDLLSAVNTNTAQCKTVKASVTNMDRLSRNGQRWELTATITDRTGSIDVAVSSEVILLLNRRLVLSA